MVLIDRRVALVTGAAKRVGRAVALRLAAAGFDVAFTYNRSQDAAQTLVEEIRADGRQAMAIAADFARPEVAVPEVLSQFGKNFSRLDVLVNNASIYEPSSLDQTDTAQMRRFWSIHVEAPLLLCRGFSPLLKATSGHVINMVDLLAERPMPEYLAYCTSKAGLWNLTLGLARELAPAVTVNAIAPGIVEWPKDLPEADRQKYLRRVPLGRAGTPQDVAEAVLFLCTGGQYITGQILRLDGGRSIA
jgi:pteridine reductase